MTPFTSVMWGYASVMWGYATRPSFVLLRSVEPLTPQQQALLLTANLPSVEKELDEGAIAVLDRRRVRIRPLPIDRR